MQLFRAPGPIFSTLVIFLACADPARAIPYPQALEINQGQNDTSLEKRCNNACGWQNQLCCRSDEYCFTDSYSQAQCGYGATTAAVAGGRWQYYTSTYVETDLVTKTRVYSTFVGVATVQATTTAYVPVATTACNCPCGPICCADNQYCLTPGQCALYGGQSSVLYYSTTQQSRISTYSTYSAPLRPTSSAVVVVTATASATTTVPFEAPVATGANVTLTTTQAQNAGGLSGGAIAGIVIGVIAGLFLLALLLLCLCFRAAWDGLVGLFGGGRDKHRRTREEEIIYERRRPAGGASGGRRWYGDDRPARVERPPPKKNGDGVGGLAAIGLGLGGLAAALGLKRAYDRRRDEKSEVSSSSYDSSYYTYSKLPF